MLSAAICRIIRPRGAKKLPITKRIEFRDTRYFEAVAQTGHVGKAARRLNISQPALTKSIRRLEDMLGTTLFERRGRHIEITPVGTLLLARARVIHRHIEDAIREIDDYSSGKSGTVTIGTAIISGEMILPAICSMLRQQSREVKIEITIGRIAELREALLDGKFDFVITKLGDEGPDLVSYPLLTEMVVVVAQSSHKIFRRPIQMETLLDHDWALPSHPLQIRKELDAAFEARNLSKPTAKIEVNSISLLPPIVEKTDLLSLMPQRQLKLRRWRSHLREIPLKETTIHRRFGVQSRKQGYLSPAARLFLEVLTARGRELSHG